MRTLNTAALKRSAFAGAALALVIAPLAACGAEVTHTGEPSVVSITTGPTTTTQPAGPTVPVVGATPPPEESTTVNAPIEPPTGTPTSPEVLAPPAPTPEAG